MFVVSRCLLCRGACVSLVVSGGMCVCVCDAADDGAAGLQQMMMLMVQQMMEQMMKQMVEQKVPLQNKQCQRIIQQVVEVQ